MFIKGKNELKSSSDLGDNMGIFVLNLPPDVCMTGVKLREKVKVRKQDIASIKQLYMQQSLARS